MPNLQPNILMLQNSIKLIDSTLNVFLIIYIIIIIYVAYIIYYINTLKKCPCYEIENKTNYSNLTYLTVIESIILVLSSIYVLIIIYFLFSSNSFSNTYLKFTKQLFSVSLNNLKFVLILLVVILIAIYVAIAYFIYYVYRLYQNVDENCPCTKNWLRYLLYIQAIFYLITFVMIIITSFSGSNMKAHTNLLNFKNNK